MLFCVYLRTLFNRFFMFDSMERKDNKKTKQINKNECITIMKYNFLVTKN